MAQSKGKISKDKRSVLHTLFVGHDDWVKNWNLCKNESGFKTLDEVIFLKLVSASSN